MVNSYQLCWILGHNKRREPWQQLILHRALSSCLFPYWPDTVHDSKEHAESKTLKAQDTLVLYVDMEDKYLRPLNNVTLFAEGISLHSTTNICYVTRFPRVGNLGAVIWVAETQVSQKAVIKLMAWKLVLSYFQCSSFTWLLAEATVWSCDVAASFSRASVCVCGGETEREELESMRDKLVYSLSLELGFSQLPLHTASHQDQALGQTMAGAIRRSMGSLRVNMEAADLFDNYERYITNANCE